MQAHSSLGGPAHLYKLCNALDEDGYWYGAHPRTYEAEPARLLQFTRHRECIAGNLLYDARAHHTSTECLELWQLTLGYHHGSKPSTILQMPLATFKAAQPNKVQGFPCVPQITSDTGNQTDQGVTTKTQMDNKPFCVQSAWVRAEPA